MSTNLDAPVTLPTRADLVAARETLQAAVEALAALRWRVAMVADQVDFPARAVSTDKPTLETIGLLSIFHAETVTRLEEGRGYADDIRDLAVGQLAELNADTVC